MTIQLVVCDLDNTLYDWVSYFVPAFYSMVDQASVIMECDREELLDDLREVHRRHHDSEHPFALLETQIVARRYYGLPRSDVAKILDPAFHAFNKTRKALLKTYPGVIAGLSAIRSRGVPIVAHTESNLLAVADRLSRLNLTQYFRRFYCRERPASIHPDPAVANEWFSSFPMADVVELRKHQRKPDKDVLLEICRKEGVSSMDTAYVGDSIVRDVLAAKSAGAYAIWASYGATHEPDDYAGLVRVTHWSEEDVLREKNLRLVAQNIEPDFVLRKSFAEIESALDEFDTSRPRGRSI